MVLRFQGGERHPSNEAAPQMGAQEVCDGRIDSALRTRPTGRHPLAAAGGGRWVVWAIWEKTIVFLVVPIRIPCIKDNGGYINGPMINVPII